MNLLRTLAAISSMTMVSRITGLLRESLFAAAFGASYFTDAFNIAFRLPNDSCLLTEFNTAHDYSE